MPKFFFSPHLAGADEHITLTGDDARHIAASLRMRAGEPITLCDGAGRDYACVIEEISAERVTARVMQQMQSLAEPAVCVTLFTALGKGDKNEAVVQKAVELGAFRICPFLSEHCIARPDARAAEKKHARLQRIAHEAASQCGRGILPEVTPIMPFSEAVVLAATAALPLFLYENETDRGLRTILSERNAESIAIVTGPEGGFSQTEAKQAQDAGLISVSLGPRILRCETAPLAALAAVMAMTGNLGA